MYIVRLKGRKKGKIKIKISVENECDVSDEGERYGIRQKRLREK